MRISQMSNEELIDELIMAAAQETQIIPTGNGRGRGKIQKLLKRQNDIKKELLKRLEGNKL